MNIKSYINKIIKEEVAKVRLKESNLSLNKLEDYFYKNEKKIKNNLDRYGFELGEVSKIRNYIDLSNILGIDSRLLKGVSVDEYASYLSGLLNQGDEDDDPWFKESRLKESSSDQEIEDIAVDLIDYMGKELPPRPNPRIMKWFQESGITDVNMLKQIYLRALKLNRE